MMIAGDDLLGFLTARNSLLDSTLRAIRISEGQHGVTVELRFSARAGADYQAIDIRLEAVSEFDFTYRSDYVFGNVEMIKLEKRGDSFYLSLDPDSSSDGPTESDRDFVVSRHIVGYVDREIGSADLHLQGQ